MFFTQANNDDDTRLLIILTLARHAQGIWIEKLITALERQQELITTTKSKHTEREWKFQIRVMVLEQFLPNTTNNPNSCSLPSSTINPLSLDNNNCIGIVNRVSDAAEPFEVKACLAILQLAKQLYQIPIVNGPDAYSLCVNKWCHHVLFQKANLSSPTTILLKSHGQKKLSSMTKVHRFKDAILDLHRQCCLEENNKTDDPVESSVSSSSSNDFLFDFLVKPNAGGFGVGISRHQAVIGNNANANTNTNTNGTARTVISYDNNDMIVEPTDGVLLLQKYLQPQDGIFYRVWFLQRRVQCGVQRVSSGSDKNEFRLGCAAQGACSIRKSKQQQEQTNDDSDVISATATSSNSVSSTTSVAWTVTDDVRFEIENQLLPTLPNDAHCGSVEFLYDPTIGKRQYFDLNLLSTLPLDEEEEEPNVWEELAQTVLDVICGPSLDFKR